MQVLKGISVASGIRVGVIGLYSSDGESVLPHYAVEPGRVPFEIERFRNALDNAKGEMATMIKTAMSRMDDKAVEIFNTHLLMLNDTALSDKVIRLIENRKINAEHAVSDVFEEYIRGYETSEGHFRELAHDFIDTRDRILSAFSRQTGGFKCKPEETKPVIVAARRLTPSMILGIPREHVLAFVAEEGGVTSHATILARSYGVPILFGIDIEKELDCGMTAIVDGSLGRLTVSPDKKTLAYYLGKIAHLEKKRNVCRVNGEQHARTKEGERISLKLNITTPDELSMLKGRPHDGIGLLRTEFLFMRRDTPPTEEEQYRMYRRIFDECPDKPVTVRLLDIGGDKLPPFIRIPEGVNTDLQLRGASAVEAFPEIYLDQVKALLRANVYSNVRLLFPMVSDVNDIATFRAVVEKAEKILEKEKKKFSTRPPGQGVMIETPAAVLMSKEILREVDFVNIGSNDLSQYTLASARGQGSAGERYHILHPALLKMIEMVSREGKKARKEVCLCGEVASFEEFYPLFLEAGLSSFSVALSKFDEIKCELMHLRRPKGRGFLDGFYRTRSKEEAERYLSRFI